jgi:hypothetical protein
MKMSEEINFELLQNDYEGNFIQKKMDEMIESKSNSAISHLA